MQHHEDYEARSPEDFVFICRANLECSLAAGVAADIPALREWCAALPMKTYGRVFVEVDSVDEIQTIETPPHVGFTWLVRSNEHELRGSLMMRAVDGWLDEWLRGDPLSGRYIHLWAGSRANAYIEAQWQRIEDELSATWSAAAEYHAELS